MFELSPQELGSCLELTGRAIVAAAWLSATARRELSRFRDFIAWLRYGKRSFLATKTACDTDGTLMQQSHLLQISQMTQLHPLVMIY